VVCVPDVHHLGRALREPLAPIVPPASLEARVLAAVAAEGRLAVAPPARLEPRARRSWLVLAFAGLGALVVSVGLVGRLGGGRESPGPFELATVLVSQSGAAEASIAVQKTGIGRVVDLRSESLPILPKGEYYELWFAGPGDRPARPNRISAGTFHPDENGRSHVSFAAAVDPALYPVVIVTAEPGDGDPRPSSIEVLHTSSP
jgi:Anti-sigma-K factor rskA